MLGAGVMVDLEIIIAAMLYGNMDWSGFEKRDLIMICHDCCKSDPVVALRLESLMKYSASLKLAIAVLTIGISRCWCCWFCLNGLTVTHTSPSVVNVCFCSPRFH